MNRLTFFIRLVLLGLVFHSEAYAEITERLPSKGIKPLFEVGIGAGSGFFPHYPAAAQGKWRTLALPTFRYRGSFFRADEEDGVRAKIIADPRYGVELSGSGAFPAPSSENKARSGMPDLDLLGEIGPQLYIKIYDQNSVDFRFIAPARAAASTDLSSARHRGFTFSPGLDARLLLSGNRGALRLRLSSTLATEEYQKYFYDVSSNDVTENRSEYHASAGYLGSRVELGYSAEWERFAIFAQVTLNNFKGAENSKSPLFKDEQTVAGILGVRWLVYHSDALEDARP